MEIKAKLEHGRVNLVGHHASFDDGMQSSYCSFIMSKETAKKLRDDLTALLEPALVLSATPLAAPDSLEGHQVVSVQEPGPDNRDFCLFCSIEIPPGPDFCSPECEGKAKAIAPVEITPSPFYFGDSRKDNPTENNLPDPGSQPQCTTEDSLG